MPRACLPPDGNSEHRDSTLNARPCGTAKLSPLLLAHPVGQEQDELVWETLGTTRLPFLPVSSWAIQHCRYFSTCRMYSTGAGAGPAEATEEAGIDDSGPTLLGGGHHQKEADFARVRSEVTEGVPPRRSWQLRHRHGNGNGY